MSSTFQFRQALERLAAATPGRKTALLRLLLPAVERALTSGKTWKQVWQCLTDEGFDISYQTFHRLLRRVRREARVTAASSGKRPELTSPRLEEPAGAGEYDPLAKPRRVEASRPDFCWQAKGLDELAHGKPSFDRQSASPDSNDGDARGNL